MNWKTSLTRGWIFIAALLASSAPFASAQSAPRPKTPSATTLASPTSQIAAWYFYAVDGEKQIAALKSQVTAASISSADIRAQLAAIAQRATVIVLGGTLPKLTVTWDDNSSNELGFKVQRSIDRGASWQTPGLVAANVTTWTDSNLAPGEYWYRVFAYNATTTSDFSNVAAKVLP